MTIFLRLALKNLIRNRRRTIITEVAIAAGAMVIIIATGLLASIEDSWRESIIDKDVGHVQVMKKNFFENSRTASLELAIDDSPALEAALRALPEVEGFAPSLTVGGLIAKDNNTTTFFGAGMRLPASAATVLPQMKNQLVSGAMPAADDEAACVIGTAMAKSLGAKVGDLLVLMSTTLHGQINAVDVELKGIVSTGQPVLDEGLLLTTLTTAQRLLDAPGLTTKYTVRLHGTDQVPAAVTALNDQFAADGKGLTAFSWMDLSAEFKNVNAMFQAISTGVALIIFFLVGIGIANTMLMNVFERTGEIGVIMAIGTQKSQVLLLFVLEGLVLALTGTVIGVCLGSLITLILGQVGIPFTPPDITIEIILYPRLVPSGIVQAVVLSIVVSTLASIYPARYASRLDPAVIFSKN